MANIDTGIVSIVADTEDIFMTEEITEALNKIYFEKDTIERGPAIRNERQGIIYALTYFKDMLNVHIPYSVDWFDWLGNESINMKQLLNFIVCKIDDTINMLENNCDMILFKNTVESIINSIQQLSVIADSFYESNCRFNVDVSNELATFPVINGVSIITNILKELTDIEEEIEELCC